MYVGVIHEISHPDEAFARGQKLLGEPPAGLSLKQFTPAADRSTATCVWESDSVDAVREYVDSTLGDASNNRCFEINTENAVGL